MEWFNDPYRLTTDSRQFDVTMIHRFLRDESYWATGITREVVERSIAESLCFGLFREQEQVGFARLITDSATFAYLADVFILPPFRGQGLSKWLLPCVLSHPDIKGVRSILLKTNDAQGLYEQVGFQRISDPERFMVLRF